MRRTVDRKLPDGSIREVQPFHMSMEGLETIILCRDDEDYDALVKILCVTAKRKNIIVIIYAVVSNHCHAAILAVSQVHADEYGQEVKRIYSMWFSHKYGINNVMRRVDMKAIVLDTDSYVRNALAYIPRNALDNGCNVNEYEWSGFKAMFASPIIGIPVKMLSKRVRERVMHTGDDLTDVEWQLDKKSHLIPGSWCDHEYLEQAFNNDSAYFMRIIGSQNSAEMQQQLIDNPRQMMPDSEFFRHANSQSLRWFNSEIPALPTEKKLRLVPYLYRTTKTTIPQLARTLSLDRDKVASAVGRKKPGNHDAGEGDKGNRGRSEKMGGTFPAKSGSEGVGRPIGW